MFEIEIRGTEQVIKNLEAARKELKKARVYKMRENG